MPFPLLNQHLQNLHSDESNEHFRLMSLARDCQHFTVPLLATVVHSNPNPSRELWPMTLTSELQLGSKWSSTPVTLNI